MVDLSKKQRKFLKENADRLTFEQIARELGIAERKLRSAIKEMGLTPRAQVAVENHEGAFHSRKWIAGVTVAVILLTAAVYGRSVNYPFVFDDHHAILDNDPLRSFSNLLVPFVDASIFSDQPGRRMYRPIVTSSYILNWAVSGSESGTWHLFNLIFHVLNGVLLFLLLDLFIARRSISALAAAAFTVHPAATETVVFLAARSTLMAATFVLLSTYFFARWSLAKNGKFAVLSSVAFVLGLLCKENVIMLVPIYPVIYWAATGVSASEIFTPRTLKTWGTLLGIAVAFLVLRKVGFDLKTAVLNRSSRSFSDQLLTQAGVWWRYFGTALWPIWLNVYREIDVSRSIWTAGGGMFKQPLLWHMGWVAMASITILLRKNRVAFLGAFFATVILVPETVTTLNLISADRRMYMPLAGLALIATSVFRRTREKEPWNAKVWIGLFAAAVVLYIPLTFHRVGEWRTEKSLFESSIRHTPGSFVSWHGLGYVYAQMEEMDKAIVCLKNALTIKTKYGASLRLLGAIYLKQNRTAEALPYLEYAVKVEPLAQRGWYNLGIAQLNMGKLMDAEKSFLKAVEQDKYYSQAYNNLGIVYERRRLLKRAETAYGMAVELEPGNDKYKGNLDRLRKKIASGGGQR